MSLRFTSAVDFGLAATADVLTRGFADYMVSVPVTRAGLLTMARVDSVDLAASQVVLRNEEPVGAALIARRGWTSRIAGMAFLPRARRQGAGRALMDHLLAEAKQRGDHVMVLEVIEQNEPAGKLYQNCGFTMMRRLVGFEAGPAGSGAGSTAVETVDVRDMAAAVIRNGPADLPWQISGETLAAQGPPTEAYRLGGAWLAGVPVTETLMGIRGFTYADDDRGRSEAVELLGCVRSQDARREWRIPQLWPEERASVFLAAGFSRRELTQLQLERRLV